METLIIVPFNCLMFLFDWVVYRSFRKGRFLLPAVFWALATIFLASLLVLITGFLIPWGRLPMAVDLLKWTLFLHFPLLAGLNTYFLWRPHRLAALFSGTCTIAILGVMLEGFVIEPEWLEVTHYSVQSARVFRTIRIVVVADLQTDAITEYEHRVLERVMAEQPDLILFAGDYLQIKSAGRPALLQQAQDALKAAGFYAPLGIFAVGGNIDQTYDWPHLFDGLPVTTFQESGTVRLDEGVALTGLAYKDSANTGLEVPRIEGFHIVLGHKPDFVLGDVQADLLVAGHTHGGQVRLPFIGPLLTLSKVPRAWAAGFTRLEGGRILIVPRGVGMERGHAPRFRFLCRPELAVVTVSPPGQD